MAIVQITVPDALMPRVVAAVRSEYPDLAPLADLDVLQQAGIAILREHMANYERHVAEVAYVAGAAATITAAYDQAIADSSTIS